MLVLGPFSYEQVGRNAKIVLSLSTFVSAGRMALPMYLFSVAPSMLGWLSTQLPILSAYPVLVLAFSAVHMMEARIFPRLQIPRWYSKLRLRLNVLAVIALMVTFSLSKNDPKLLEELKSEKDNPTTLMQLLTGNRKEPSDPSSTPKGPE